MLGVPTSDVEMGLKWSLGVCYTVLMKIISLNIRGVKRMGKVGWIKEIIRNENPCVLGLQETKSRMVPKPFRVFDMWLDDDEIDNVFRLAWEKPVRSSRPDCVVRDRFKSVKEALKSWSKAKFGNVDQCIETNKRKAMRWELEAESRNLNNDELNSWLEARKSWLDKENEKTSILKQKARIKWDIEGDENSKYFHAMVKRRCSKNSIRGLLIDGVWCEDPRRIKIEIFNFYKTIFSSNGERRPRFANDRVPKISVEDAGRLEEQFSEKEIWDAVSGCGSDKAPGPDGFNFRYIKRFWATIKSDVFKAVRWFWDKGEFSKGCNSSFVTLIPKISDCLIGSFYKIIAKILAERVKKVIGKVIGEVQNAFIKDRYILDGVLIANETIEFLKKKKMKGLVFKVDFEKAYDSIEWKYLLEVMRRMGFGIRWCKWVAGCLKSSSISILVNGSPTSEFAMERRVRQGDPLSPFLFILAAEGLNALLKEAVDKSIFKGILVGAEHLQYADDTIIFGGWSRENACNLMNILKCFEEVAGLKINLTKSKIYGVGVEGGELDRMACYMRCSVSTFPFTYLGLPIGVNMRRTSAWNGVVDRFKSRLSGWKEKSMSLGGRLKLVKSVLGSLPLYYFSMFRVPSSIISALKRARKNFFWGGLGEGKKWLGLIRSIYGLDGGWSGVRVLGLAVEVYGLTLFTSECEGCVVVEVNGAFSVKALSQWIEEHQVTGVVPAGTYKTSWNNIVPRKVNVFAWRASIGRIPVRVELDKKGIDLDSLLCPCCENVVESIDHALALCEKALGVWDRLFAWWGIGPVNAFTIKKDTRLLWQATVLVSAYLI
ncbi:putative RNA-directed DNA polymerase [Tanacetum coccineum]